MKSLLVLLTLLAALPAAAQFTEKKLLPSFKGLSPTYGGLGEEPRSCAMSATWLVVGVPRAALAQGGVSGTGAVQVFDAASGAPVRRLFPPNPLFSGMRFGSACAVQGDLALIAADAKGTSGRGAVYVYRLSTGKLVATLRASGTPTGDRFGTALAVDGHWLLITSEDGPAWLYDLRSMTETATINPPSDFLLGDRFGIACAIEGDLAVITSPFANATSGAAYLYRLSANGMDLVRKITPAAGNQRLGSQALMHQGLVILGTTQNALVIYNPRSTISRTLASSTGESVGQVISADHGVLAAMQPGGNFVHLFDLASTGTMEYVKISAPANASASFGKSLALQGIKLAVPDAEDDTLFDNAGAVHLISGINRPLPFSATLANQGGSSPGLGGATLSRFREVVITPFGQGALIANLAGAGTASGTHRTVFTAIPAPFAFRARSGSPINDLTPTSTIEKLLANETNNAIFQSLVKGPGITSSNSRVIYRQNSSGVQRLAHQGISLLGTGLRPLLFNQVSQSYNTPRVAFATRFAPSKSLPIVEKKTDSALVWANYGDDTHYLIREGDSSATSSSPNTLGEVGGVHALFHNHLFFSAFLTDVSAAQNQALFRRSSILPVGETTKLIQKGNPTVNASGGLSLTHTFSSLLAVSADDAQMAIAKATSKSATTSKTTTGLWRIPNNAPDRLLLETGMVLGSLKISRIDQFWAAYGQCLALVRLAGPGVTSANDRALLLVQTTGLANGQILTLLREGDPAPGCPGALISTLSRVDVDPFFGHYLVLATLAGAPTSSNLALFRGHSRADLNSLAAQSLRKPYLALRKGFWIGLNTPITSFTLPENHTSKGGAGAVGLGRALQQPANVHVGGPFITTLTLGNPSRAYVGIITGVSL
jgi:hypothetical protein